MKRNIKGVECMTLDDQALMLGSGLHDIICRVEIVDTRKSEVIHKIIVGGQSRPILLGVNWVLTHIPKTVRDYHFVGIFDTGRRVGQLAFEVE